MAASALSAPPLDLFGILSGVGMTRQGEMALAAQLVGSAWTAVMTGRVLPLMAPIFFKWVIFPFTQIVKSVAKSFILLGIVGWLFGAMVPIILAQLGMAGAGAFVGRALGPSFPYQHVTNGLSNFSSQGLEYFKLDSDECRQMISCKAGEFVVDNYPALVNVMERSGVMSQLQRYSKRGGNTYIVETVTSLSGSKNGTCDETLDPCDGLDSLFSFFDPSRASNSSFESTTEPPTTTTSAPDGLVNFISQLAGSASTNNNSWLKFLS